MAIKNSWSSGEVLTAADLTDTMKGVYINAQTGVSYTFGTADGFVSLSNASGGTATIPANATAAFNTGAVIGVMNAGTAGSFTIGTAAGVTLNAVSGTTVLAPLEKAELVKLGTNTWQLAKASTTKVLQVVYADTTTGTTVASSTYTDTGLSASITPQSTSNKIMVLVSQEAYVSRSLNENGVGINLLRGSTQLINDAGKYESIYAFFNGPTAVGIAGRIPLMYLDSPASTSALTYKTQGAVVFTANNGQAVFQLNSARSTMILMEIAA